MIHPNFNHHESEILELEKINTESITPQEAQYNEFINDQTHSYKELKNAIICDASTMALTDLKSLSTFRHDLFLIDTKIHKMIGSNEKHDTIDISLLEDLKLLRFFDHILSAQCILALEDYIDKTNGLILMLS
jgi:hypothetical protein